MAGLFQLVVVYVFGGVTFIPLVLVALLCHAVFFLPQKGPVAAPARKSIAEEGENNLEPTLDEKLLAKSHEPSVAAGYFAVTREYVPGGVNGKPPARTSPAGESLAAESPSVYQSMYRSIFDRNKTQSPSIEAGKAVKKARNVFYVVLRHAHLLLFDNSEQIEVRHVIALDSYNVDIYAGSNDPIPEGELWIKKNCIRLSRKPAPPSIGSSTSPFFLFSENCSEKEDFYHALLVNLRQNPVKDDSDFPAAQPFETEDMIKLIRQLHVSDDSVHTRWINALIGRIFLALYKTSEIEDYIRSKLTKKMARASKPNFITSLRLEQIDIGQSAPIFSNPKLKSLTVDGDLTLETDVKYTGNFKIGVAAIARLELGSRFKAREVNLILACVFKKVEGRLLLRVKPPPSNRVWMSFEAMPKLDISVEPIVSSRQITYGVILRAIESKIRELISESIVYPNWDDSSFLHTEAYRYRGGIWKRQDSSKSTMESDLLALSGAGPQGHKRSLTAKSEESIEEPQQDTTDTAKPLESHETPSRAQSFPVDIPQSSPAPSENGSLTGSPSKFTFPEKPKAMRAHSFATAATPIVSKGPANIDAMKRPRSRKGQQDAASTMKVLSSRSPEPSPTVSPVGSPSAASIDSRRRTPSTTSIPRLSGLDAEQSPSITENEGTEEPLQTDPALAKDNSHDTDSILNRSTTSLSTKSLRAAQLEEKKAAVNQSITSATAAAKAWGIGVWNRSHERKKSGNEPMGRGRPLPPPGQPLPGPSTWSSAGAALSSLRRKPVPPPRPTGQDVFSDSKDPSTEEDAPEQQPQSATEGDIETEDTTNEMITTEDDNVNDNTTQNVGPEPEKIEAEQGEEEQVAETQEDLSLSEPEIFVADEIQSVTPLPRRTNTEEEDFMTFEEEEKLWDPEAMSASG